ncbi:hypothetical protein AKO1_014541 [Acrasis kona]|uniref:Uncharacterized protein n=1 Tax=Acrasis kona TaxID=1008807 RepID=A0AAW2Z2M0_9EUKA
MKGRKKLNFQQSIDGSDADFADKALGDDGIEQLFEEVIKQSKTLKTLRLEYNNITSRGARKICEVLKQNKSVIQLNMYSNLIGDLGAYAFADLLLHNATIKKLNLNGCGITDQGVRAIAKSMKTNVTLTDLNISNSDIQEEVYYDIIEALCKRNANPNEGIEIPDFPFDPSESEASSSLSSPSLESRGSGSNIFNEFRISKNQPAPRVDYFSSATNEIEWLEEREQLRQIISSLMEVRNQNLISNGRDEDFDFVRKKFKVRIQTVEREEIGVVKDKKRPQSVMLDRKMLQEKLAKSPDAKAVAAK